MNEITHRLSRFEQLGYYNCSPQTQANIERQVAAEWAMLVLVDETLTTPSFA